MSLLCQAAFSQIDITPGYPTTLIGRNRPQPSQGIQHRLYAQALLFRSEADTFCLIAIDSLGLTVPLANVIRTNTAGILDTDISHIMLNFSHTHSAPEPTPTAVNGERYFSFLCTQIEACVQAANSNFHPCKIGWALAETAIGKNRRDGGTALDSRLGALIVAAAESGKPIALVARIAAHPCILPSENLNISSDFIGIARDELQRHFGFPVMFLQGAAGNINATGTNAIGEGDDEALISIANALADSVKQLSFDLQSITDIQMLSTTIDCCADVPTKEQAEKMTSGSSPQHVQDWINACAKLRDNGIEVQQSQIEINYLRLNEGCICGVAEEIFCELALDTWQRTGNPLLFLNGYTNGCTGYLPSREEWHKGGYEVINSYFTYYKYSGRVAPYRAETADRIVETVVCQWNKLTGKG